MGLLELFKKKDSSFEYGSKQCGEVGDWALANGRETSHGFWEREKEVLEGDKQNGVGNSRFPCQVSVKYSSDRIQYTKCWDNLQNDNDRAY